MYFSTFGIYSEMLRSKATVPSPPFTETLSKKTCSSVKKEIDKHWVQRQQKWKPK